MKSPFKFLYAYDLSDKDVFFGREDETEALFGMALKTSLMLIYGLSGTGKTSLIRCGLASRFVGPDWLPFYIRRDGNLHESTLNALHKYLYPDEPRLTTLLETVEAVYDNYLRPVYLIFDQFEELFILGDQEEQLKVAIALNQLIHAKIPCKIILVMREEFIGQLYLIEKEIPTIYDFRLRVEPMNFQKVKQVITGSFKAFNIELTDPEKNIEIIYNNIGSKKSGIQLPYLQVYLDSLWREDFSRTYPDEAGAFWEAQMKADPPAYPPLELTTAEIEDLGAIENVLSIFLLRQQEENQKLMALNYPGIGNDTVRQILNIFVTPEGTKRPVPIRFQEEKLMLEKAQSGTHFLKGLPDGALEFLLNRLINARILLERENTLELAHDSLAALIDRARSDEERQINEVYRRLQNAFDEYNKSLAQGEDLPTSRTLLLNTKEYLDRLSLTPELFRFFENRMADAEQRDNQARESAKKEQRLREKAEKSSRQAKWLSAVSIVLCIVTFISYIILQNSYDQLNQAILDKNKAEQEKDRVEHIIKVTTEENRSYIAKKLITENTLRISEMKYDEALEDILSKFEFIQQKGANGEILRVDSLRFKGEFSPQLNKDDEKKRIAELLLEINFYYREIGVLASKEPLFKSLIEYLGCDYLKFRSYHESLKFDLLNQTDNNKKSMSFEEAWFRNFTKKYFPRLIPIEGAMVETGTNIPCEYCDTPARKTFVDQFFMGRTEVTNFQYNLYQKANNRKDDNSNINAISLQGDCPVVNVDLFNAISYCNWLNNRFGLPQYYTINNSQSSEYQISKQYNNGFRIPTEFEWEYAAKGGQANCQYPGGGILDSVGWYIQNSKKNLHPVAQCQQNEFGFYDMAGNAAEWCWNGFVSSDTIIKKKSARWFKGGAYDTKSDVCQVYAHYLCYERKNNWSGFRIACSIIAKN